MRTLTKDKIVEWAFLLALLAVGCYVCYHTFPPGVLHRLGLKKTDAIVELSGFGAFFSYALLGLLVFRTSVAFMFPGWDMKKFRQDNSWPDAGPRVWQAVIIAIALIVASSIAKADTTQHSRVVVAGKAQPPEHLGIALSYENVREKPAGSNSGKEVNMFLRSVGLSPGYSWCAAYVSFCLNRANVSEPLVVSAMARAFVTQKSIKSSQVSSGRLHVPDGSIVTWKRGTGPFGHVGFVIRQLSPTNFETIEGNTSSGNRGSQFDGGGVYRRKRTVSLTDHFRITHFTLVTYKS